MKKVIIITSTILLFLCSCASSELKAQSQASSLIQKNILSWSDVKSAEVLEIETVQDIPASDSLKYMNEMIRAANKGYDKEINALKASAILLNKSKKNLYYGTSTKVNPYYKTECDNHIAAMKKTCDRINAFSDGLNGKSHGEFSHVFAAYNSLKNKEANEIVGKIYKAKIKYTIAVWQGGSTRGGNPQGTGTENRTEIRYFLFDASESKVIRTLEPDEVIVPQEAQEEFGPYGKLSVDDEGNIKILESDETSRSEENSKGESTVVAAIVSAEFTGACYVVFQDGEGHEVTFYNPNLGVYRNEDGVCGVKDKYRNKKFNLTYHPGKVEIYIEDVGDQTIETNIITNIELVKK